MMGPAQIDSPPIGNYPLLHILLPASVMGRYFADKTYVNESVNRYYALRKGTNYPFKLEEWIMVLQMWSICDLDTEIRIIRSQTAKDLSEEQLQLIQRLLE